MDLISLPLCMRRLQICSVECADKLPGFKYYGTQFGKQVRSTLLTWHIRNVTTSKHAGGAWHYKLVSSVFSGLSSYDHPPRTHPVPLPVSSSTTVLLRHEYWLRHLRPWQVHHALRGQPRRDLRWVSSTASLESLIGVILCTWPYCCYRPALVFFYCQV